MPLHPLDHIVASDLSQLVLQRRHRRQEITASASHDRHRRLDPISVFDAYAADRESVPDSFQGESFIPTWHYHGRKR